MVFWIISSVFLVLLPLLLLFVRWRRAYTVLTRAGIQGPTPTIYYGNHKEIILLGLLKFIEVTIKEYGNVCGYYIGTRSYIIVKDMEILKQITTKHFNNFMDRQRIFDLIRKGQFHVTGLVTSRGSDWKRKRKILSKSFNTVNLKKMSPLINKSCESLKEKFDEIADTNKSFDFSNLYGLYTLEVILGTGFGHCIDVINGEADELVEAVSSIFKFLWKDANATAIKILSNFPFLEWYVRRRASKTKAAKMYLYMETKAEELIMNRLEGDQEDHHQDLLQLLVDARADSDDDEEDQGVITENDSEKRKLTNIEIARISISFLLGGYDTTSTALAYTSYLLALHPLKQDKLYKEIMEFYSSDPNSTIYEASQNIMYLDMVLQESLRMFPPAPITSRHTSQDVVINGQMFPKDSNVIIPIMAIHHSPEIWPNPSEFKPERFTKDEKEKRHQMAHIPFGWGPRSCIAMRLALMEAKMALVAVLKDFKFVEAPDTEKPLKTSYGVTMVPTNGVHLKLERRMN